MNFIRKIVAGLIMVILLFCTISIIDYHPADPSMLHATDTQPQNIFLRIGASFADGVVQAFGYTVFWPFIFVLVCCVRIVNNGIINNIFLRVGIIVLTFPVFALIFSYIFDNDSLGDGDYYTFHYGGYLGYYLKSEMIYHNKNGVIFTTSTLICITIILFTLDVFGMIYDKYIGRIAISNRINVKPQKIALIKSFFNKIFTEKEQEKTKSTFKEENKFSNQDIIFKTAAIGKMHASTSKAAFDIDKEMENLTQEDTLFTESYLPKEKEFFEEPEVEKNDIFNEQKQFFTPEFSNKDGFSLPPLAMLHGEISQKQTVSDEEIERNKRLLAKVLYDFGIRCTITNVSYGPIITLYELEPASGTKSSRVIGLADDIARSMSVLSVRIAVMPGKNAIGIELPNTKRQTIYLKELLASEQYQSGEHHLPLAVGKNISGEIMIVDLAKMPHLLIAGTTGSGKSIAIHSMIISLLYKYSPEECKLIMIDPKMLELSLYDGIPHLLTPVVTEPEQAVASLKWIVKEMESRYRAMSVLGVRNIIGYNSLIKEAKNHNAEIEKKVQVGFDKETGQPMFESISIKTELLPYIVVVVDEMADLMVVAGKDIETSVQRLAQMARAAGIHLIMATQRPSVDIITGVIKANFPTRISFQVASRFDSKTIIGEVGAEQLIGAGDMLYMTGGGRIERLHGAYVDENDIEKIVNFLRRG